MAPSYMFSGARISNGFSASVALPHIQHVDRIDCAPSFFLLSLDLCLRRPKSTEWGMLMQSLAILSSGL